jgi:hypothetical protein
MRSNRAIGVAAGLLLAVTAVVLSSTPGAADNNGRGAPAPLTHRLDSTFWE